MVKIGFVGTGDIAHYHLNHLAKIKGVQLVGMCDVNETKARETATKYKCPYYTDYKDLFNKEKMDACYICVPPFAHDKQELVACERGIHLFMEKPVCLSVKKAKEISEAIRKNDIISSVGYQDRYLDVVDKLKNIIKDRKVGIFLGYWMGGFGMVHWWREKILSGGQIVEQTTHIFDMIRYLFGELEEVYASGTTGIMNKIPRCDIEDASSVTLRMKSGLVGSICSANFLKYEEKLGIDIFAEGMGIQYKERSYIRINKPNGHQFIKVTNDPGMLEDEIFVEAVKTGDCSKIRSPYSDALKSLEATLAANESMSTGKVVKL